MTRPTWPGRRLAVAAAAAAVVAVAVAAVVAGAAGLAAGVLLVVAVVLGVRRDQLFLDPAPLAGSGLWRGQRRPRFQLLGPTWLPESVVERVSGLAG